MPRRLLIHFLVQRLSITVLPAETQSTQLHYGASFKSTIDSIVKDQLRVQGSIFATDLVMNKIHFRIPKFCIIKSMQKPF